MERKAFRLGACAVATVLTAVMLAPAEEPAPAREEWAQVWASGDDGRLEAFLLGAEIIDVRPVGEGFTRPQLLTLELHGERHRAIFKSVDQKRPPKRMSDGTLDDPFIADRWQHEVAAYRIDRLIGLGLTPVTVARPLGDLPGSLQLWVPGAHTDQQRRDRGLPFPPAAPSGGSPPALLVFDALIYNADRNASNILRVDDSGRLWLIDHSRAFRTHEFFPGTVDGRPLSLTPGLRRGLAALDRETLEDAVGDFLYPVQITALLRRRDSIIAAAAETRDSKGAK